MNQIVTPTASSIGQLLNNSEKREFKTQADFLNQKKQNDLKEFSNVSTKQFLNNKQKKII